VNDAIASAVASELGHLAPFTNAELEDVTRVEVAHARDLDGVEQLSGLRTLRLTGCELGTIAPATGCPGLVTLHAEATILGGSAVFAELTGLRRLTLQATDVSDLTPLLGLQPLLAVEAVASPLDEASYREVSAELERRNVSVTVSDEEDWKLTLALWDAGLRAGYYDDFGTRRLCAPGLSISETPESGQPALTPDQLRGHLEAGTSLEELYRLYAPTYTPPSEPAPAFDPERLRERGTADDARRWLVGASLPDELYRPLMRFVDDFPMLHYLRETEELHAEVESRDGVVLPAWLKQVRSVLAAPFHETGVCHLELLEFPGVDFELGGEFGVYEIRGPADDAERRQTVELSQIYPVVAGGPGGLIVLAVRLDEPQDDALYFYHVSELSERADGVDAYGALRHYVDLFDRATAVTLQDRTRIERRRGGGGSGSGSPTDEGPLAAARRAAAGAAAGEGAASPEPVVTSGPGMKLLSALTGLSASELATADGFERGMSALASRLGALAGARVGRDETARADAQDQLRALGAVLREHGISVPLGDAAEAGAPPEANTFRPQSRPAEEPGDRLRTQLNGVLIGLVAKLEALRAEVLPPHDDEPGRQ
jgi:hypothetical protein